MVKFEKKAKIWPIEAKKETKNISRNKIIQVDTVELPLNNLLNIIKLGGQ